jgi:hypothetical protein
MMKDGRRTETLSRGKGGCFTLVVLSPEYRLRTGKEKGDEKRRKD